ncbi:MAG: hypothetical protein ACP5KN_15150 [Armatimonadota bacterium]
MRMWLCLLVVLTAFASVGEVFSQGDEREWTGDITASIAGVFLDADSRESKDLTLTIEPRVQADAQRWLVQSDVTYTVTVKANRPEGGIVGLAIYDWRRGMLAEATAPDSVPEMSLQTQLTAPATGGWSVDVHPTELDGPTWQIEAWIATWPELEVVDQVETDTHLSTTFRVPRGALGGGVPDLFSVAGEVQGRSVEVTAELWLEDDPERRWVLTDSEKLEVEGLPEGTYLLRVTGRKPWQ